MIRIAAPDHAGSRPQAQALVSELAPNLAGETVVLDCAEVLVATPSFLDEIVKQVLSVRDAAALQVQSAPPRSAELLERAAANRQVASRLQLAARSGA